MNLPEKALISLPKTPNKDMKYTSIVLGFSCSLLLLLNSSCMEEARPNIKPKSAEIPKEELNDFRGEEDDLKKDSLKEEAEPIEIETETQAYCKVNNLRVRELPDLNSKVIAMLSEGETVVYLKERSDKTETVELRGQKVTAPFYRIKTQKGESGWVFGGALSFKQEIDQNYRAVVAFFIDGQDADAEVVNDWSLYSSEALEQAKKEGIITLFIEDKMNEVHIKDANGQVLDKLNLLGFAPKKRGLICLQKGKKPYFVEFSPAMAQEMAHYYQIK